MDVEARQAFWTTVRGLAGRGRTILFATHYLEEADVYADRVVLLARGRVVADGPPTEIKAMVGTRTIRATLPGVPPEWLERLPGRHARRAARRRDRARLRRLRRGAPRAARRLPGDARHRASGAPALEEAFLELTGDPRREDGHEAPSRTPGTSCRGCCATAAC